MWLYVYIVVRPWRQLHERRSAASDGVVPSNLLCGANMKLRWGLLLSVVVLLNGDGGGFTVGSAEVVVGASNFVSSGYSALGKGRVGVIANPTSVLPDTLEHIVDRMHSDGIMSNGGVIFAPEHGFRGASQAGHGGSRQSVDPQTQLKVYSAYGLHGNDLANLIRDSKVEQLVFDIQDIGVRYYTYIWTMFDMMVSSAIAKNNTRFVVLDRPNPLGGKNVKGPVLEYPQFSSFVGRLPIPQIHGMTVAELARYFNSRYVAEFAGDGRRVELITVEMTGWSRSSETWPFSSWVSPSPNIPTFETAQIYSGMGIIEGTNISEGRGTTRPFRIVGAQFLNYTFSCKLRQKFPQLREVFFIPTFSKFQGKVCAGVDLSNPPSDVDPQELALEIIIEARRYEGFGWTATMDLLTGGNYTRLMIDSGATAAAIMSKYRTDLDDSGFLVERDKWLLYHPSR